MNLRLLPLLLLPLLLYGLEIRSAEEAVVRGEPVNPPRVHSYASMLERVKRGVVNLSVERNVPVTGISNPYVADPFFQRFFDPALFHVPKERFERSLGSGVLISSDGYIVASNRAVSEAEKIVVYLEGREFPAEYVGGDPAYDLAVVKISGGDFPAPYLFDSEKVSVGDLVFAVGNPFGMEETVSMGIVSSLGRSDDLERRVETVRTDAVIGPNNTGGALVNSRGEVVGIINASMTRSGGDDRTGVALAANEARRIVAALVNRGNLTRSFLGVVVTDMDPEGGRYEALAGAVVTGLAKGSPADRSGLRMGDLIVRIGETPVMGAQDVQRLAGALAPGETAVFEVFRDRQRRLVEVTLGGRDEGEVPASIMAYRGLTLEDLSPKLRKTMATDESIQGVAVTAVAPGSDGATAGFVAGDVIIQVGSHQTATMKELEQVVSGAPNATHKYVIYRRSVVLTLSM